MDEIISSQMEILNIKSFLNSAEMYSKDLFPDIEINELFKNLYSGGRIDESIFRYFNIKEFVLGQTSQGIKLIISILLICVIHSIVNSVFENLDNKTNTKKIVDCITYLIISTLLVNSFLVMISLIQDTIKELTDFMKLLYPLLVTLMIVTGNIVTTSVLESILLFFINGIGFFVNSFVIPLVMVTLVIYILSNVSDDVKLDKFGDFFKGSVVWILGIVLTIFVSLVSLEGTLSSSVDGITSKTAKSAISTFVPVVGKVMGDATDTILGCCNILKNSVGIIGIFIIFSIVALPCIRIFIMYGLFKLLVAISEPMIDKKIVTLLNKFSNCFKILLGVLFTVSILFIIGITLVIKITNSQMMYR